MTTRTRPAATPSVVPRSLAAAATLVMASFTACGYSVCRIVTRMPSRFTVKCYRQTQAQ